MEREKNELNKQIRNQNKEEKMKRFNNNCLLKNKICMNKKYKNKIRKIEIDILRMKGSPTNLHKLLLFSFYFAAKHKREP